MATTEQLKARAKLSEQIDKYGPDFLRNVLNDNPISDITPKEPKKEEQKSLYAQMIPGVFDNIQTPLEPIPMQRPPEQPVQDTTNIDTSGEQPELTDDPNDTIQHPEGLGAPAVSNVDVKNLQQPQVEAKAMSPEALQPEQQQVSEHDGLARASDADIQRNLLFGMLKAGQMAGGALAGTKLDTSLTDAELAKDKVFATKYKTDLDVRQEEKNIAEKKNKRDSKSEISKFYQDLVKKLNPNINVDGLSAEHLEQVVPKLEAIASREMIAKENREARLEAAKMHAETMKIAKSAKMDEQESKDLIAYRKERDPMLASSRSPLGKEVSRFTQSEHALGLIHGITDLDQLKEIQKKELAVALATMISPGLPHHETIQSLSPDTVNGYIAEKLTALTGNPAPTNTKGIAQLLKSSVENQREISAGYINKFQSGVDAAYSSKIQRNPEAYSRVSETSSFDVKSANKQPEQKSSSSQDSKIAEYAQQHGLDYTAAEQILKKRGYNAK